MNTIYGITKNRIIGLTLPALAALLMSQSAAAEQEQSPSYEMTFHEDGVSGRQLSRGAYVQTVEKTSKLKKSSKSDHKAHTNLCVAYALTKDLGKAMAACGQAVAILENKRPTIEGMPRSSYVTRENYYSDLAIALSNRGVLYALNGDVTLARESFEAALQIRTRRNAAEANLRRLSQSNS